MPRRVPAPARRLRGAQRTRDDPTTATPYGRGSDPNGAGQPLVSPGGMMPGVAASPAGVLRPPDRGALEASSPLGNRRSPPRGAPRRQAGEAIEAGRSVRWE